MKDALTNIDVYVLSRELSARRFSKIVRVPGGYKVKLSGGQDLLVIPGRFVIPTSYVVEADRPDNLSIISRKRMGNAPVVAFEQLNFDRILRIRTESGSIVLELFGDGNVVLTDENGVIIYALRERDWRDRSVRRGVMYNTPPAPKIRPGISFDEFSGIFTAKDAVRSLVRAGLPPIYAEEICLWAGVEKNTPVGNLSGEDKSRLFDALTSLFRQLDSPDPVVVRSGEEIVDITPIPLSRYEEHAMEHYETFSEALDVLTPILFQQALQRDRQAKPKRSMVEFWKDELESARKELAELEAMIAAAYENAHLLEDAIQSARSGKPRESAGPFKLKEFNGRDLVYDFTPPT